MYQKFKAYVKEYHMLSEQDKVIVGVSGGADSICLLFMLLKLQKEMGFSIAAVHVHHGIRGEGADADERYVKEICAKQEVELFCFHENVPEYVRMTGCTEEEAGRNIRREIFEKVLKEQSATKIALAHHMNDNVETFLWNLCRGTGFTGLGAIRPVADEYIRPLLCLKREEIEEYLREQGIGYCVDETNSQDDYTRNRIRNHIVPYLEECVNTQAVSHIAETIENIRIFNEYVEKEVEKYVKSCVVCQDNKYILNKKEYEKIPEIFRKNVIYECLAKAAGMKRDIESVHVSSVEMLLDKQVGKKIDLPYGMQAFRIYEGVEIFRRTDVGGEKNILKSDMPDVKIRVFERTSEMVTFPEKTYTKWFDYDIIKCTVEIRHRESGDYIAINKNGKTQKLKQYFINEKIPQNIRDKIWLVADGQEIMWIVGYRQNQMYQTTDKTTKIMEICFEGKDID